MGRPRRVPERGDIDKAMVANRLGLSVGEFDLRREELEKRGFPEADVTTGQYAAEAVDMWRLRRYPALFPQLTWAPAATDAGAVFGERMRRMRGQGRG